MEIHAPEKPIHSLREFLFHMFTVTLGILIALTLDSGVEAYRHAGIAGQARAFFRTEIAENRAKAAADLQATANSEKQFNLLIDYLEKKVAHQPLPNIGQVKLATSYVSPSSAAWETAVASQALSYMSLDEARALADAYAFQRTFAEVENAALRASYDLTVLGNNPNAYSDAETAVFLSRLRISRSFLRSIEIIERQLLTKYDHAAKTLQE
jgi:hypothetical protein